MGSKQSVLKPKRSKSHFRYSRKPSHSRDVKPPHSPHSKVPPLPVEIIELILVNLWHMQLVEGGFSSTWTLRRVNRTWASLIRRICLTHVRLESGSDACRYYKLIRSPKPEFKITGQPSHPADVCQSLSVVIASGSLGCVCSWEDVMTIIELLPNIKVLRLETSHVHPAIDALLGVIAMTPITRLEVQCPGIGTGRFVFQSTPPVSQRLRYLLVDSPDARLAVKLLRSAVDAESLELARTVPLEELVPHTTNLKRLTLQAKMPTQGGSQEDPDSLPLSLQGWHLARALQRDLLTQGGELVVEGTRETLEDWRDIGKICNGYGVTFRRFEV